jgi:hypothetical protein
MVSNHDRMAQLASWGCKISELSEQAQTAGARVRFEDLLCIDELKALHAIAQTKLDEFEAATDPERAGLEVEVQGAWVDLAAAFDRHKIRHSGDI